MRRPRAVARATATPLALVLAAVLLAPPLAGQSLLERPPNLSGNWVGRSGQLYFNFLHRFTASDAPERKVSNVPTFTLAVGLPAGVLLGAHYATNSQLAPRYPNEWEFFARAQPFEQRRGAPLDVGAQVGYNLASEGVDGEVSLARLAGPLRLIAAARLLADPYAAGHTRFAAGGGLVVRLGRYVALAGDVATLLNRADGESAAWSAGLHLALPHTPHTLSLHAANTNAYTLQGLSRGGGPRRYGFEFTVPITPQRWFAGGAPRQPPAAPAAPAAEAAAAAVPADGQVVAARIASFAFAPPRLEVAAGTTVEWRNDDPVAHTVTADDGSFDSGTIAPGASWRHTFERAGSYTVTCTPHPFMRASVVVAP